MSERERKRDRERQRETERERQRQRDRERGGRGGAQCGVLVLLRQAAAARLSMVAAVTVPLAVLRQPGCRERCPIDYLFRSVSRERERERDRETDRETDKETDRQRQADRQIDRQTDRQTDRQPPVLISGTGTSRMRCSRRSLSGNKTRSPVPRSSVSTEFASSSSARLENAENSYTHRERERERERESERVRERAHLASMYELSCATSENRGVGRTV